MMKKILDKTSIHPTSTGECADFTDWSVGSLIDYIVSRHHGYVRANLLPMKEHVETMVKEHGELRPEFSRLRDVFARLSEELLSNMTKEEKILFPFIKKLVDGFDSSTKLELLPFFTLERPFQMMQLEHTKVKSLMEGVWSVMESSNSTFSDSATWRICYAELREFKENLKVHFHLENNELFPKALEMEKVQHRLEAIS